MVMLPCSLKPLGGPHWFPSIAIAGSVLHKQRNSHMNASASVIEILLKTGSIGNILQILKRVRNF